MTYRYQQAVDVTFHLYVSALVRKNLDALKPLFSADCLVQEPRELASLTVSEWRSNQLSYGPKPAI